MKKDRSIGQLLDALALDKRGWVETDHGDGDLCAIGIAQKSKLRHLDYISTWNKRSGRYYYECETPSGPDPTDYEVVEKAEDVDFESLLRVLERHLGGEAA